VKTLQVVISAIYTNNLRESLLKGIDNLMELLLMNSDQAGLAPKFWSYNFTSFKFNPLIKGDRCLHWWTGRRTGGKKFVWFTVHPTSLFQAAVGGSSWFNLGEQFLYFVQIVTRSKTHCMRLGFITSHLCRSFNMIQPNPKSLVDNRLKRRP